MLVFIDESGDPGMQIKEGSSTYFVMTPVLFEDRDEAEALDKRIGLLKREFGFNEKFEFHFHKLRADYRKLFLQEVAKYDFFCFGIVINKAKLTGKGFQFPDSFYKYACNLAFQNIKPHLSEAIAVIDGSGSRIFRQQLTNYLKKRINDAKNGARYIKKVKLQDSKTNHLLQLADMICGSVARSYGDKKDANDYRQLISHREMHVQLWPK